MANITLTIPDAQLARVIAAVCASDPANPPIPTAAAAKATLVRWVTKCVQDHEIKLAQAAVITPDVTGIVT